MPLIKQKVFNKI